MQLILLPGIISAITNPENKLQRCLPVSFSHQRKYMKHEEDFLREGKKKLQKEFCPYINEQHGECYFTKMDSRSIEAAVSYCLRNYTKCRVYESLSLKRGL